MQLSGFLSLCWTALTFTVQQDDRVKTSTTCTCLSIYAQVWSLEMWTALTSPGMSCLRRVPTFYTVISGVMSESLQKTLWNYHPFPMSRNSGYHFCKKKILQHSNLSMADFPSIFQNEVWSWYLKLLKCQNL